MSSKRDGSFFTSDLWDFIKIALYFVCLILLVVGLVWGGKRWGYITVGPHCNGKCCPIHRVSGQQFKKVEEQLNRIEKLLEEKAAQQRVSAEVQNPPVGW